MKYLALSCLARGRCTAGFVTVLVHLSCFLRKFPGHGLAQALKLLMYPLVLSVYGMLVPGASCRPGGFRVASGRLHCVLCFGPGICMVKVKLVKNSGAFPGAPPPRKPRLPGSSTCLLPQLVWACRAVGLFCLFLTDKQRVHVSDSPISAKNPFCVGAALSNFF